MLTYRMNNIYNDINTVKNTLNKIDMKILNKINGRVACIEKFVFIV